MGGGKLAALGVILCGLKVMCHTCYSLLWKFVIVRYWISCIINRGYLMIWSIPLYQGLRTGATLLYGLSCGSRRWETASVFKFTSQHVSIFSHGWPYHFFKFTSQHVGIFSCGWSYHFTSMCCWIYSLQAPLLHLRESHLSAICFNMGMAIDWKLVIDITIKHQNPCLQRYDVIMKERLIYLS